jgi:hypothetical protein
MTTRVSLLTLIAALLLGSPLTAETKIEDPDGLPTELMPDPDVKSKGKLVWLAYEGFRPRVRPDLSSPPVEPDRKYKYMQSFYAARSRQSKFYLLATSNGDGLKITEKDLVGWVPAEYLVRERAALTDPKTGIAIKALVVNKLESLGDINELMFRRAPSKAVPGKDEPKRLYTTLFVYGITDQFVLVGDVVAFSSRVADEEVAKRIQGWLPLTRVEFWNTREAVEWDHEATLKPEHRVKPYAAEARWPNTRCKEDSERPRRTTEGQIYWNVEDAKAARSGGTAADPPLQEGFDDDIILGYSVSPRLPHDAPRFPVLGVAAQGKNESVLLKVGGIGGLADSKGRLVLKSRDVYAFKQALDRVNAEASQTDLVILIDDTESMDVWYDDVAKAVRQITEEVRRDPTRSVRIAVSYYNDDVKSSRDLGIPPTQINKLQDVKVGGDKIADAVLEHKKKVGGGGDDHEMVFRGIFEACDKSKVGWRTGARKVLVVIGDCGDISADKNRAKDNPTYLKDYNVQTIVEQLIPANLDLDTPIEFYGFQVLKPVKGEATGDFRDQLDAIRQAHHKQLLARRKEQLREQFDEKKVSEMADCFNVAGQGEEALKIAVKKRYDRLMEEKLAFEEQIRRLKGGQWLTTKLTPEMERRINMELQKQKITLTLDELRKTNGLQLFQVGYVWTKTPDGLPLVRERVFINSAELNQLIKLLNDLDPKESNEPSVTEFVVGVIRKQINNPDVEDRPRNPSIADITRLGSGTKFKKALLNKKLEELETLKGKTTFEQQELYDILHARDLLEDANNGLFFQYVARPKSQGAGQKWLEYERDVKTGKKERRAFYPGESGDDAKEDEKTSRKRGVWFYLDYQREWP